jgi:hypothetical protein
MKEAVAHLSSPLPSVSLQHRDTHLSLQSAKDRLNALEEAEAQRQKASLDWEIYSRVAQGVSIIHSW